MHSTILFSEQLVPLPTIIMDAVCGMTLQPPDGDSVYNVQMLELLPKMSPFTPTSWVSSINQMPPQVDITLELM